jgi:transposase
MPPVDRNNPKRAASSESQYSVLEFMREFPDDAACLDYLWRSRYAPDGEHAFCPRCATARRFKRYENKTRVRHVWKCTSCTQELSPTAGTIFHKSSTSLHLWFYAMWIMTSTRCGVSAKQLERELGVTYKTAWRMFHLIRTKLMEQDGDPLSGDVEADETLIGGKMRNPDRREREALGWDRKRYDNERKKTMVFGAVERGGRVRATVIPNSSGQTLHNAVQTYVMPGSILFTDEWLYDGREDDEGPPAHPPLRPRLRRRRRPHADHRGLLVVDEKRHSRRLPLGLEEALAGLLERVRVAVQPPRRSARHVPALVAARDG